MDRSPQFPRDSSTRTRHEEAPTVGKGLPEKTPTSAPKEGIPDTMIGPDNVGWQILDYGQYLHPSGPDAARLRDLLSLEEGQPEKGQCMLLSFAGSTFWGRHGVPQSPEAVHSLATSYRVELLEAARSDRLEEASLAEQASQSDCCSPRCSSQGGRLGRRARQGPAGPRPSEPQPERKPIF